MYVCMYVCMYMYVYIYIYIHVMYTTLANIAARTGGFEAGREDVEAASAEAHRRSLSVDTLSIWQY